MGLAELFLGSQNPIAKYIGANRQAVRGAFTGFGQGTDLGSGLANAAMYANQGAAADDAYALTLKEKADREQQMQKSIDYLRSSNPKLAELVAAGMDPNQAFAQMLDEMQPASAPEAPSSVREWEYFNTLGPAEQSKYLTMKRSVPFLDLGPEFARPDPVTGQPTQTIEKDNFTPAYDAASGTATGKTDAETKAAFDSLNSKMPGLKQVVTELGELADKATYTVTGRLWDDVVRESGNMPPEGAIARTKYMSMVDNQVLPLLKDVFGAAFTVQEGESLRATLGAPDKSPVEKKAVLEAFIEQKMRDLQGLESRLPGGQSNKTATGVTWSVGP